MQSHVVKSNQAQAQATPPSNTHNSSHMVKAEVEVQPSSLNLHRLDKKSNDLSPARILSLQQTVGNQVVLRLLQAKGKLRPTEFTPTASIIQRKKLESEALENAKQSALRSLASPDPFYVANRKKGITPMVTGLLKGMKLPDGSNQEYDDGDVETIVTFLTEYLIKNAKTDFDGVVADLAQQVERQDYITFLRSIAWPQGKKPGIVYGPTVTTGFYDATKHTITLNPEKLVNATEMLDTLTFECQNALQRPELRQALREGGHATAGVEYNSDRQYLTAIMQVNKAQNIDELVVKLAIPSEFLVEASYETSKISRNVERPERSLLPQQDKRQAIWWWKTKNWSDEQRKEIWMLENHGEGVASSTELYEKQKQEKTTVTA